MTIFNNDESAHPPTLLKTEFTTDALIGQVDKFQKFQKRACREIYSPKDWMQRSLFPVCVVRRFTRQVDSMELVVLAESGENHNFLSSLIKQPKNYPWTYSDTFSQILSVKNNSNFIFLQFCIFVCGPIAKNEKRNLRKVSKNFKNLTNQC